MQLIGVAKESHLSSLGNWANGTTNIAPVCADASPFPTWAQWDASQRDLFIIDRDGTLITRINLTSFNPDPESTCGQNYETIKNVILNAR